MVLRVCVCRCVFAACFIAAHSAAAFIKRFRHPCMCVRKECTKEDTRSTPAILLDRRQHVDIMHKVKADSHRSMSVDLLSVAFFGGAVRQVARHISSDRCRAVYARRGNHNDTLLVCLDVCVQTVAHGMLVRSLDNMSIWHT